MTVISNTQGCGQMAVKSWVDVISISGEDPKEESNGSQKPPPEGEGTSQLGGGVSEDSSIGDNVADAIEKGGEIIKDALNEALNTMPKTSAEVAKGALEVVKGNGGEMVENVADAFTESIANDVEGMVEDGLAESLPNGWKPEVEVVWTSQAKTKVEVNLQYDWTVCGERTFEIGSAQFALQMQMFVKVGGGWQSGNGLYGDVAGGLEGDLWHKGSGWGFTGGVQQGVNGGTIVYGGIEVSFGN